MAGVWLPILYDYDCKAWKNKTENESETKRE